MTYAYDNDNRLTGITQGTAGVSFTYDAAGRRASLTLPDGIVVKYGYDQASELTGLTYSLGGNVLGNLTYAYDGDGRRIQRGGSWARTGMPNPTTSTAVYNVDNELTNWNGATLSYDANGNMTSDGTNTYTWNARNQLATIAGNTTDSFEYGPFGRRLQKTISGATTDYLYDGVNPVQELSGGSANANLLTGLNVDEYFQRTDSTSTSDFLTDALGSTLALADASGAVQTEYTYSPFGSTTAQGAGSANSFRFTGRDNDGDGLYYYRARYYDPMFSRFVSEDPLRFGSGQRNFYSYVGDDPAEWIDPTGARSACPFHCAARIAENLSLAGALGIHNPIGRAFLGNTFSGLVDAADHFDSDPVKAGEDLGLGGLRQGVMPGGGPLSKGIVGETTDAIINAFGRSVTGAGSEPIQLGLNSSVNTAESILSRQATEGGVTAIDLSGAEASEALDLATPIGWAKWGYDAATFGVGLGVCFW